MECSVARALKPSLRREFAVMKSSTHQSFYEEFVSLNANNGVPCEDFSVDDLLDFSNGEFHVGNGQSTEHVEEEEEEKHSIFSSNTSNSSGVCGTNESDSIFASGLAVPTDDIEELEWVSHFVDDCAPELSLLYPVTISEQTTKTSISSSTPGMRLSEVPKARPDLTRGLAFPSGVPVRPRSKRQRANCSRVWSFGSYSQTDLSSFPSSCTSGFLSMPYVMLNKTVQSMDSLNQVSEPVKKRKQRLEVSKPGGSRRSGGSQVQRRCSHCQVQKTPQWRAGPLGPKTLCNACGVRYKSGRLFPEYRPACSPTFSSEIHSNSHRRVTEIRKRNEMSGRPESGLNRAQMMIPSC